MKLRWTKKRSKRFWEKVIVDKKEGECWWWVACTNNRGYGVFYYDKGISITAHKISWAVHKNNNNLSSPKKHVMHTCDNKICVNPKHLELGTAAENNRSAIERGLMPSINILVGRPSENPYCKHGHERTPENTFIKAGYPLCKICVRKHDRESKLRVSLRKSSALPLL